MKKPALSKFFIPILLALLILMSACSPAPAPATSDPVPGNTPTQTGDVLPEMEQLKFADTIAWDAEFDVIVVGFGAAGATTSITAADNGAKVLLTEKAPYGHEGGNTRYCMQAALQVTDKEAGITYFKALRGPYEQSDAIIEKYVEMTMDTSNWLKSMGGNPVVIGPLAHALPEFDFPGGDAMKAALLDGEMGTGKLWNLLSKNVHDRDNIQVWYDAPGKELIQDPYTNTILGVKIEKEGQLVNVRAKNGVVLCTGGFENNQQMIHDYLNLPELHPMGSVYNTGDGIIMAQAVGAQLWHMGAYNGSYLNFMAPDSEQTFTVQIRGATGLGGKSAIFVGTDGTRFVDESVTSRHGYIDFHGRWINTQTSVPAYAIFDDAARADGKIYASWSEGNLEEIEKGWIIKADTIAELATKIDIDASALESEIKQYNQFCSNGKDVIFGRDPSTLKAIEKGPYYAMKLVPSVINTQGGPKRNENAEILDTQGNPIPHLYSAGELGSIHPNIYQGAGNIGECIAFGRIAGENAAKQKADLPNIDLKKVESNIREFSSGIGDNNVTLAAGEYLGEGTGMGGRLTVKVKMDGDKIISIDIVSHSETPGISDGAIKQIPAAIIAAQSTEVDVVSGATLTSNAIKNAVKAAVESK